MAVKAASLTIGNSNLADSAQGIEAETPQPPYAAVRSWSG